VIKVLEEPVQVSSLFELSITLLQHLGQLVPDLSEPVCPLLDDNSLLWVAGGNLLRFLLQGVKLGLDGSQVPLHA